MFNHSILSNSNPLVLFLITVLRGLIRVIGRRSTPSVVDRPVAGYTKTRFGYSPALRGLFLSSPVETSGLAVFSLFNLLAADKNIITAMNNLLLLQASTLNNCHAFFQVEHTTVSSKMFLLHPSGSLSRSPYAGKGPSCR